MISKVSYIYVLTLKISMLVNISIMDPRNKLSREQ